MGSREFSCSVWHWLPKKEWLGSAWPFLWALSSQSGGDMAELCLELGNSFQIVEVYKWNLYALFVIVPFFADTFMVILWWCRKYLPNLCIRILTCGSSPNCRLRVLLQAFIVFHCKLVCVEIGSCGKLLMYSASG